MEENTDANVLQETGDEIMVRNNQAFVLCDLYEKIVGVDVTIKIGEKLIHGHKAILSSTIPYFAGMFSSRFKEDKDKIVVMQDIDSDAIEMIISHAYTGFIKISRSNWKTLLIAADFLQYQSIKDFCCDYLEKHLDFDSLFQIKNLPHLTYFPKLSKLVDGFINENFDEITLRSEFLKLSFDELMNILSRDELKSTSELAIFKSLMKWIKYDFCERKLNCGQLFKQIRLHLISKEDLVTFVSNEELITEDKECREYLFKALLYHMLPGARNLPRELWTRTRSNEKETIYIIGGESPVRSHSVIEKLKLGPFSSVHQQIPDSWIFHGTALLGNKLHLLGGNNMDGITNRVLVFDLKTQSFSSVAPMSMKRQVFGTVVIDNKIFVCGGLTPTEVAHRCTPLASVESFDPRENKWTLRAPMSTPRYQYATVVLGGYIYAIGGLGLSSVERYDSEKDIWTLIAPMNCDRYCHGAAVYDGKIFVAGGHSGGNTLNTAEVYDPEQGTWTSISSMIHPREDLFLVVYGSKLYAIGGRNPPQNTLTSIEELRPNPDDHTFFWIQVAHKISIARWGGSTQVIKDRNTPHQ